MKTGNLKIMIVIIAITITFTSVYLVKHYDMHYCTYWCNCSDNCKENGYYAMFKDNYGNVFIIKMKSAHENMTNKRYVIVSKKGQSQIFGVTSINDNEMFDRQPQFMYNIWRR